MSRVVIVGAGVLGSAIAWRVAEAGHQVTILDAAPGGSASSGSLAWLNASFAEDPVYNRLRHDSLELWADLKRKTQDLPIQFSGAILWEQDHFDLPAVLTAQDELGRPATLLDRNGHLAREPNVPEPPDQTLALDGDGYGNPIAITEWFLEQAIAAGAVLERDDAVAIQTNGAVTGVQTANALHEADHVIIVAGVKIPTLLEPLGVSMAMDNQPGLLVTTSPAPPQIDVMLATNGLHGWQGADGRFLIGADFGGGAKFDDPDEFAHALVARLGEVIPAAAGREVEKITVRERPMPADGRPAIGPLGPQGLYVVCTHSGMTLAPVIAQMVASEIGGSPDARLAPYRPGRESLAS